MIVWALTEENPTVSVFGNITAEFQRLMLLPWRDRNLVVSNRQVARKADPQEETGPTVSMSNLRGNHTHFSVKSCSMVPNWKSILILNTFIFLWLQVFWLSWLLPVQVTLHYNGDIVVRLLQLDRVHHRCKADVHQTHACFLQHLPVCASLPRLPFKAKPEMYHMHRKSHSAPSHGSVTF